MAQRYAKLISCFIVCAFANPFACKARTARSGLENQDLRNSLTPENQGYIGSCASFGFLGMIESYVNRNIGVQIDLSQRYQLLNLLKSNDAFWHLSEIQFNAVAIGGLMPEAQYPYSGIRENRNFMEGLTRFLRDGVDVSKSSDGQYLEKTMLEISKYSKQSNERVKYLKRPELFGPLPGNDPKNFIAIPALAKAIKNPLFVPKVEGTPCFSLDDKNSKKFISPHEFADTCLKYRREDFTVFNHANDILADFFPKRDFASIVHYELKNYNAVAIGYYHFEDPYTAILSTFTIRAQGMDHVVWDKSQLERVGGGHGVTVVGSLHRDELLANDTTHYTGLLANDEFEKLDLLHDLSLGAINFLIFGRSSEFWRELGEGEQKTLQSFENLYVEELKSITKVKNEVARVFDEFNSKTMDSMLPELKKLKAHGEALDYIDTKRIEFLKRVLKPDRFKELERRYFAFKELKDTRDEPTGLPIFEVKDHPEKANTYIAVLRNYPSWILKEVGKPIRGEGFEARKARRTNSNLGKLILAEDGIFLIKNSWGVQRGVEGYYLMTWKYFTKNVISIMYPS